MSLRKRSVRALQMNEKRWRKENYECEVTKNSNVQNVRLEKLNTMVEKEKSAVGNYILVDFNQVNNLLQSAKCQYCEKQTLKLERGAKLGFSYNLKLLCSNCDENKTVVNKSLKSGPTSHDVNLRITQAFSHIGRATEAVCEYNKGTVRTIVETQKALGVPTGGSTKQLATILDSRKQQFRKRRQNTSNKLALKLI
ncbi:hypothetical protein TNIN_207981 [Trichonephila inaurata madagascariensis]|uniref:Mutator-like transposase domain-containing protein n=1 Tax=Trichonephila inaurata madagascariensis TaxID=2747483 RepID=A0A8X6WRY6_9ARAC|nr:hypothetical protein TNIN_207981 [Trichonephila inaurata madagascariensis]